MNHEITKARKMNEKVKVGDWVRVPGDRGRKWTKAEGRVAVVLPPYCKVKVSWQGRTYSVVYKIEDVTPMKRGKGRDE